MRLKIIDAIEEASKHRKHASDEIMSDLFELHPDLVQAGSGSAIYTQEEILEDAFKYYREHGFPYRKLPIHICKQEINALSKLESNLLTTTLGYHVADTYHPHRFHSRATTLWRRMESPFESFSMDKRLRRAIEQQYKNAGVIGTEYFSGLGVVTGTQGASNFRPGVALRYYRKFCKFGANVIDPCTGYGGRLLGFIASGLAGKYYGIDPSVKTHQGNLRMSEDLGFADKVKLINKPAEDCTEHFLHNGTFDFSFTSPPYFRKEEYANEDTQSFKRYPKADAWRKKFLQPFIQLQYEALKPGCYAAINIADVNIGKDKFPLSKWIVEDAERIGFEHRDTDNLVLSGHRFGSKNESMDRAGEQAIEPVFIFRKPK